MTLACTGCYPHSRREGIPLLAANLHVDAFFDACSRKGWSLGKVTPTRGGDAHFSGICSVLWPRLYCWPGFQRVLSTPTSTLNFRAIFLVIYRPLAQLPRLHILKRYSSLRWRQCPMICCFTSSSSSFFRNTRLRSTDYYTAQNN